MKEYLEIVHNNSSIKTLGEFLYQNGLSIAIDYVNNVSAFLDYKGDTKKSNRLRIIESWDEYSDGESTELAISDPNTWPIKVGTVFIIPKDKANPDGLLAHSSQTVFQYSDFPAFLSEQLLKDFASPGYKKKFKDVGSISSYRDIYPNVKVFLWSRIMNKMFDISCFVIALNTSGDTKGATFSLELAPINAKYLDTWGISKSQIQEYVSQIGKQYYSNSTIFKKIGDRRLLNDFFFERIISSQDLLYIRYEQLEFENLTLPSNISFSVENDQIVNGKWDKICLVDSITATYSPNINDYSINVVGRDLIKPLIEDGAYFFPVEYATNVFENIGSGNKLFKRIFGKIATLGAFSYRNIEYSVKFVINQLANTGFVPDSVFEPYRKKNKFFALIDESISETTMSGVWQIIDILIDKNVKDRVLVDSSIATQSGSLMNFIDKIADGVFVEFFGDTYGSRYYYIFRRPPFDEYGIKSMLTGYSFDGFINADVQQGRVNPEELAENVESKIVVRDKKTTTPDFSIVIDIEESDLVEPLQLTFDDQNVYTWFKIDPNANFFGKGSEVALAYIPAIALSEYIDIWGSRPLDVTSNYIRFLPKQGVNEKYAKDYMLEQAYIDLKYLIDSHSYLPFTRRGVVTIQGGDRRIKKKTMVRLKTTGEIFYVSEEPTNTFSISGDSINRSTTLKLERGMVEEFIYGKYVDGIKMSYFNIVQTPLDTNVFSLGGDVKDRIVKNWIVNKNVFDFFLNKRQFANYD